MDLRGVFYVIGFFLMILAAAMLVPFALDVKLGNESWKAFAVSIFLTGFSGASLSLINRHDAVRIPLKQAFVFTSLSWVVLAFFASFPFTFSALNMSFTDAMFESVSGITTTGSTVLNGLDTIDEGILLWRSMLQWLGGIGFIVMAVAVLPMLQVGGMQLFKMESSDTSGKVLPRVGQMTNSIASVYLILTFLAGVSYWIAGMSGFDAINHAMTTIATGGYSTHDASIGFYKDTPAIEWIASFFIVASALPFLLYVRMGHGKLQTLFTDHQVQTFLGLALMLVVSLVLYRIISNGSELDADLLRSTTFNALSLMTGTGYVSGDFMTWGAFAASALFFAMFLGGCAGSTTCGMKIFRVQILFALSKRQIHKLLRPHGVFIALYNRRPIDATVMESVVSFIFFYLFCFIFLALCLSLYNLDWMTSLSGAASAISNVGPGMGDVIGPTGTFASMPDGAKWLLCAGMILGRLEIFTVLVLLSPSFWRN